MGLWKTRHHSMELIARDFKPQAQVIESVFAIIDECIDDFSKNAGSNAYHRICGLTLAKARNYALGAYGLILDGLGQEAGALIRPFIEYHELLTYFRLDPTRVHQAIDETLPTAGKRSQLIEGRFKGFREYLNDHASHSSYSYYSLNHLVDKNDLSIRKEQLLVPEVLFRNMGDFFVQLILLAIEAINCLQTAEMGCANQQAISIDRLKHEGFSLFNLDERTKQ